MSIHANMAVAKLQQTVGLVANRTANFLLFRQGLYLRVIKHGRSYHLQAARVARRSQKPLP